MSVKPLNMDVEKEARAHQDSLTKPRGALGRLEDVACWFAARQGKVLPDQLQPHIAVFAGDHGVCEAGVSAFPSVVTGEMVKNFARGGAAINVLARQCDATLSVVDVGVISDISAIAGIEQRKVRPGTANLLIEAAMGESECVAAMDVGRDIARQAIAHGANLLIAGDMGIGNTTASACLICHFTDAAPRAVVGFGTGVDETARNRKIDVVERALSRIASCPDEQLLQEVGGLEIAAMAGFYLQAAESGVPVVIDGFIASAAALAAQSIEPSVNEWMMASHVSCENGHALALQSLGLTALINFEMRLGEGSGAALIVPLLQSAIALHNEMATFASAAVTGRDE